MEKNWPEDQTSHTGFSIFGPENYFPTEPMTVVLEDARC
jgi:hypothetical protein